MTSLIRGIGLFWILLLLGHPELQAQKKARIPAGHFNLNSDAQGLFVESRGQKLYQQETPSALTLENLMGNPQGTRNGLYFDFNLPGFKGKMYYGFIPYGDSKHPSPVYFRQAADIMDGKTSINIKDLMKGRYDMVGWEKNQKGTIGYRIVTSDGHMLYDGIVSFTGVGPFEVDITVVEGPFVTGWSPPALLFPLNKPGCGGPGGSCWLGLFI